MTMSVSSTLRPIALGLGLVLLTAACSAPSPSAGTASDGLAFADPLGTGISESCDQLERTVLASGGLLGELDQEELMDIIGAVDGELMVATAAHLARGEEPTSTFTQQVDDATYAACGLPLYSAAGLMESYGQPANELPCFVYTSSSTTSGSDQYVALDCASGEEVVFQSTGEWVVSSQATPPTTDPRPDLPVETTTTEPVTTTEATTTTSTTESTTTAPPSPSATPSPTAPTVTTTPIDPDAPPVTDEFGEIVETTVSTLDPAKSI